MPTLFCKSFLRTGLCESVWMTQNLFLDNYNQGRKQMKSNVAGINSIVSIALLGSLIGGCASTASKPQQTAMEKAPYYVDADDRPTVSVETAGTVVATTE